MVPYNLQDMPSYSRLLQGDDDNEYFFLDDLKPIQSQHAPPPHHNNVYLELQPASESTSSTHMFLGGAQTPTSSRVGMEIPQVDSTRNLSKKRKSSSYHVGMEIPQVDSTRNLSKKRKSSSYHGSDYEDDTFDDNKSVRTDDNKKHNHSEIEKRRRDKMNTYILELATMVPICNSTSRKADKLTVLRMAVQHLKTIRGTIHSYSEGLRPPFLSEHELKQLILQATEGFLIVVTCDRAKILYTSESITRILNLTQVEVLGKSWLDLLHPNDVQTAKIQLSSFDLYPREKPLDDKTYVPLKIEIPPGHSKLWHGGRRSCFLRYKYNSPSKEADTTTGCPNITNTDCISDDRIYIRTHCVGYLKPWAGAKALLRELEKQEAKARQDVKSRQDAGLSPESSFISEMEESRTDEREYNNDDLPCLVAIARVLPNDVHPDIPRHSIKIPTIQFYSRHTSDGKFIFCDEKVTLVLGFLPQDLVGTSMYEYFHKEDIPRLAKLHKTCLYKSLTVTTETYRFRNKDGHYVHLQSVWKPVWNPWTKDFEFFHGKNTHKSPMDYGGVKVESSQFEHSESPEPNEPMNSFDFCTSHINGSALSSQDTNRMLSSHIEASKIGRQIAEGMSRQRPEDSSTSPANHSPPYRELVNQADSQVISSVLHEMPSQSLIRTCNSNHSANSPGSEINNYTSAVRNNVTLTSLANDTGDPDDVIEMIEQTESPQADAQSINNHGNDEAAMAVIMSLLEADAGLGGPVDFTGLPWPLP
ncbi:protein cycle-like isoform X2 [Homalodisca vitripennis]|uniref:protein cycle-like isoform X2 n=1 Tax=Homalodisca vitripennis TaxID=197043 RepID=UPI001EEAA4C0|nr:protein cycle-like isoform X2 [Homalodisca vitripennis]